MTNNCCKVGEAIDRYDVGYVDTSANSYLIARWKGQDGYPEASVRTLTKWFNQKVIKNAYEEHGRYSVESRLESDYKILNGSDENKKQDIIDNLVEDGIDGEELANSFISPATLVRHFNNCLETKKSRGRAEINSDWEQNKIEFLRHAMLNNAEEAITSLAKKERIACASEVEIDIRVMLGCPDCSSAVSFDRALKRGYVCKEHNGSADDNSDTQTIQNE